MKTGRRTECSCVQSDSNDDRSETIRFVSVASHLGMSPAAYDRRIRGLIPHYDELIAEAARALGAAQRPIRRITDLGIGTGTLTRACLRAAPEARVTGIELDASMSAMAKQRLGRLGKRVRIVHGNFLDVPLPASDAIVASYALHHINRRRDKGAFYRKCARALRSGGVLVSGDCFPPDSPQLWARDVDEWTAHLARTFGTHARAKREFESWKDEDTYVPLAEELDLLHHAGFRVDVPWRRSPFAVVAAVRVK
jgi:SAM-dependent methyltransferase